jgi:hypothetical protein
MHVTIDSTLYSVDYSRQLRHNKIGREIEGELNVL